ncbi:MAG TPA: DUF1844 domain-containing protein [Candidatus Eisenbacteria bacterium]|nr:DUF1844 domain-containing protein [Candidatus Eisenbacteria bacterium]
MPEPEKPLSRRDLFLGLIHSFQGAAMQQMGKVPNPFTNEIERDLMQARLSIDMLEMLEERTAGNLTGEETRFLKHVLTELRLNYVAEVEEDRKAGKATPDGQASGASDAPAASGAAPAGSPEGGPSSSAPPA